MVTSRQTSLDRSPDTPDRRRVRRLLLDLLLLVVIVIVGAVGAFGAGIWAMPTSGTTIGHGGRGSGGASGLAATPSGSPTDGPSASASALPDAHVTPPLAWSPMAVTTAMSKATPWKAWKPTTPGTVTAFALPAPWVGGTAHSITASVYLPGGYATSNRAYPVIYEVPFSFRSWDRYIGTKALLDAQMMSGAIPASVVVFVYPANSPYHDTECATSADGRLQLDTFFSSTLVQAIDARYRTIPTAAARSVMGFSQGGFCAAMLALRHPDVFATALSISGYYQAGIVSSQTPWAWRVFGGNPAVESAYSPLRLVGQLTAAQRAAMLLVLEANPEQPFYGPQYEAMIAAAHRAGVSVLTEPMAMRHSWVAVKAAMPQMLGALAAHEAGLGVFG